ncbi:MAG: TIGR03905 family TSCPD domain-containing protein [Clostridia bacterium]|nr:TIGR03905 family TSCPD domain-containing protein [Clostridia bacterium]
MVYTYKTRGVCSSSIEIEAEDEIIKSVKFTGGCNGNLKGIGELVKGMKIDDVISKLKGVKCGFKDTSCPAQLALALQNIKDKN